MEHLATLCAPEEGSQFSLLKFNATPDRIFFFHRTETTSWLAADNVINIAGLEWVWRSQMPYYHKEPIWYDTIYYSCRGNLNWAQWWKTKKGAAPVDPQVVIETQPANCDESNKCKSNIQ